MIIIRQLKRQQFVVGIVLFGYIAVTVALAVWECIRLRRDPRANHSALLTGAIYIWPVLVLISMPGGDSRIASKRTACLSNAKQVGLALVMYTYDNDERWPKENWYDKVTDITKNQALRCPLVPSGVGYGLNDRLLARTTEANDRQILVSESKETQPNAFIHSETDLIARHDKLTIVATEGSARALGRDTADIRLHWDDATPLDMTNVEIIPDPNAWSREWDQAAKRTMLASSAFAPFVCIAALFGAVGGPSHRRNFWWAVLASSICTMFSAFVATSTYF